MRKLGYTLFSLGLGFGLMASLGTAHAETLDDATIQKIYNEATDDIRDVEKSQAHMRERLADNFQAIVHSTHLMNNETPVTNEESFNKDEMISSFAKGHKFMQISTYQFKIVGIKYAENYAYVKDSQAISGTANISRENGEPVSATYTVDQNCLDTLSLVNDKVQIMQSECLSHFVFQQ